MVNPRGPSWLLVRIIWEESSVRGRGLHLSVGLVAVLDQLLIFQEHKYPDLWPGIQVRPG